MIHSYVCAVVLHSVENEFLYRSTSIDYRLLLFKSVANFAN